MLEKKKAVLIILLITCFTATSQAATLRGTIYIWSDFEEPLKNAVVEVNSTPVQYIVATTGTYSFNLSPGNYLVGAKYYRDNVLEYSTEEDIQIDSEGDFVHDLLLFPPTDNEYEFLVDINLTNDIKDEDPGEYDILYIIILISLAGGLFIFYWLRKKRLNEVKKQDDLPQDLSVKVQEELPEDLMELYDTIIKMGGRVTQKDLRKKITCSEAKVSLMIADLQDRGFVRKIKKGRYNIIIAENKK